MMKIHLLVPMLALSVASLQAQPITGLNLPGPLSHSQANIILAKQLATGIAAKGTATQKRLNGFAIRHSGFLSDSGRNVYSSTRGSLALSDDQTYVSTDEETELFFRPQDPRSIQYIQADSSFYYGLQGNTPLHLVNNVFNTYDGSNRPINSIFGSKHYVYQNYEQHISYNANNQRLTVQQRDTFQGGVLTDKQKHFFIYDAQSRIILDSMAYVPQNFPIQRTFYTYNNAGQLINELLQNNTISNGFVSVNKSDFAYDAAGRLLSSTGSQDDGNGWFLTFRDTFGYTGAYTHYSYRAFQSWDSASHQWVMQGTFNTYDIGPNNAVQHSYLNSLFNGVLSTGYKGDYFYNANNFIDSIHYSTRNGNGTYNPPSDLTRFYYEDYTTTGVAVVSSKKPVFVYPNPAGDRLFIEGDLTGRFLVTGINGQRVSSGAIPAPGTGLDVSSLMPGIYTIVLQDRAGNLLGSTIFVKH